MYQEVSFKTEQVIYAHTRSDEADMEYKMHCHNSYEIYYMITGNVEYLLDSVQASTMLSNSEMLILLNQAPSDREKLAALLNISPEQTSYITNAPAGCGLLRYGGALVPFKNQFPKDTELYRLMTTKPDESIIVGGKTK